MAGQTPEEKEDIYKSMYADPNSEEKVESVRPDLEEKQPPKDEPDDSEPLTEKKEEAETSAEKDETAETEAKAEEEAEKKTKKQGDIKSALRETRGKFKDYRESAEKERIKLEAELEYYRNLRNQPVDEHLTDDEKLLKQRLDTQERELQELKAFAIKEESQRKKEELIRAIDEVDNDLTKENVLGFKRFYPIVTQILKEMPEEEQVNYDTPEGWKELYRQEFPNIQKMFIRKEREEKFAQKDAAKEKASFLGEKGGSPEKQGDKPYDPINDYFKERGKKQIVS
jgi:hypothetical protein